MRVKNGPAKPAPMAAAASVAKPPAPPKNVDTKIPTIPKPKVAPKPVDEPEPEPVAKVEEPKPVPPAPKPVESAKVEAPKVEAPKVEVPKVEAPKPETPEVKATKTAPAKVEPAKVEPAKVEPAPAPPVVPQPVKAEAPKPVPPPPAKLPPPVVAPPRPMNLNNRPANLNTPRRPAAVPPAPPKPSEPTPAPAANTPSEPAPAATTPKPAAPNVPPQPQRPTPPNYAPAARGAVPPLGGNRPMGPSSAGPRPLVPPVSSGGRPAPNPGPPTRPGAAPRTPGVGQAPPGGGRGGIQGTMGGSRGNAPANNAPRPNAPAPATVKLTAEQIMRLRALEQQRGKSVSIAEITTQPNVLEPARGPAPVPSPAGPGGARPVNRFPAPFIPATGEEGGGGGGGGGHDDRKGGNSTVPGRDQRHRARQDTRGRTSRGPDARSIIIGPGGRVDTIDRDRHFKKGKGRSHVKPTASVIGGKVEIALPITIRSLSEAIGMKVGELLIKLKNETNSLYSITSSVDLEVAELIATARNIELVGKKQETAEDETMRKIREAAEASHEENTTLRAPIVTIMGHVDHGKTSLLDKIRQEYGHTSDVVSTETGGITQVLRAWRVEKDGKPTTFLDTPGHEAFTKMRARGANVTDIAVIVVSAADGIMPQTAEAVSHAKAAGVDIIVALNKVDLPGAQPDKVKNRLYDLELVPEEMGGDVPVILTSAVTGQGIAELLDAISLLAEVAELKADSTLPGSGTCLEAYKEEGRGVVATLLVQNGTLKKGDTVLCGSTYGRVRAMYDDLGKSIDVAGPSVPVKFIGLDDVPDADDPFYVVASVATAREIADKRRDKRSESDRVKFQAVSLDKLREQNSKEKISELKVILKAEARGSVEAIKKELEKLIHDEVRVRVLHAGIGAITESDVQLALTSPEDTLIVGFNVTSDDAALKMAENRDIKVREYQIIYNLVDDIKAALEGRLKPIEEVVHLGRAVVRESFRISKVGTIAGCYVTSGTLERSARIRVIRDGVVIFPTGEKHAGLDNLKRFKDDVREVREGFECGLKLQGFDDIKVGDVIEAFKIEIKTRTL